MIGLIFILIIVEVFTGIWLIAKMQKLSSSIEKINLAVKQSGFTGNLTEIRLSFAALNRNIQMLLQEQKQKEETESFIKIINFILLIVPILDLLIKKIKKT
ncbi:MAG: hypothetical protein ACI37T_07885 [Candidatus Gastranaerophilaceae bacterium]